MRPSKRPAGKTRDANVDAGQLDLDGLLSRLDEHPGEPQYVAVSPSDIGGELLPLLSRGLYTNPLDSVREYVQNSVDANARGVTIALAGNSLQIVDDGHGMSMEDILGARQFGLSPKSIEQHVGFRGIGIYSAFDLCERLVITSLRADDDHSNVLTFDFSGMRKQLEIDRQKGSGETKTSLTDLLSQHTGVAREKSAFESGKHFTIVDLQAISDTHLRQLSNRKELRRYLLENLPIDFDDRFPHAKKVRAFLQQNVPAYNAITVTLQAEDLPDEIVGKYADEDLAIPDQKRILQSPKLQVIRNSSKTPIAAIWSCLNTEREWVQPRPRTRKFSGYFNNRPDYKGFVYKVKGFTIGTRRKLLLAFTRKPQLYNWFTGEVYVLDNAVVPNAERDEFETNQAKRTLELAVQDAMDELEKVAELFQAENVARDRLHQYENELEAIEAELESDERPDDRKTYSKLDEMLKDWQRQKKSLRKDVDKIAGEELGKKIRALQKRIRQITETESESARRAERARKGRRRNGTGDASEEADESTSGASSAGQTRSLVDILEEAGWDLESDVGAFAEMVQDTLEAVLGPESEEYRLVVNDIAARLVSGGPADDE
jgi:hypothetical protein